MYGSREMFLDIQIAEDANMSEAERRERDEQDAYEAWAAYEADNSVVFSDSPIEYFEQDED